MMFCKNALEPASLENIEPKLFNGCLVICMCYVQAMFEHDVIRM